MRHLILNLIFLVLLAKVHGEEFPDYTPFFQDESFLQDDSFLQDHEVLDGDVASDGSTDLFTEDLAANPSNNCFSYDDVDNIFLSDAARVRLRRETCLDPDAPPLTPPTDIYVLRKGMNY